MNKLRAAFESWLQTEGLEPEFTPDGEYSGDEIHLAWKAWFQGHQHGVQTGYEVDEAIQNVYNDEQL